MWVPKLSGAAPSKPKGTYLRATRWVAPGAAAALSERLWRPQYGMELKTRGKRFYLWFWRGFIKFDNF